MTPSGIDPATFQFVAQHLNHCATTVPIQDMYIQNVGHDPKKERKIDKKKKESFKRRKEKRKFSLHHEIYTARLQKT